MAAHTILVRAPLRGHGIAPSHHPLNAALRPAHTPVGVDDGCSMALVTSALQRAAARYMGRRAGRSLHVYLLGARGGGPLSLTTPSGPP